MESAGCEFVNMGREEWDGRQSQLGKWGSQWKVWNGLHSGYEARQEAWQININGICDSDHVDIVGEAQITAGGECLEGRWELTFLYAYCVPKCLQGLVTFLVAATQHMMRSYLRV